MNDKEPANLESDKAFDEWVNRLYYDVDSITRVNMYTAWSAGAYFMHYLYKP